MNPRLAACLLFSILAGSVAAAGGLLAGSGWIAAYLLYSLGGSLTLVAVTLAVRPGDTPRRRTTRLDVMAEPPGLARVLA